MEQSDAPTEAHQAASRLEALPLSTRFPMGDLDHNWEALRLVRSDRDRRYSGQTGHLWLPRRRATRWPRAPGHGGLDDLLRDKRPRTPSNARLSIGRVVVDGRLLEQRRPPEASFRNRRAEQLRYARLRSVCSRSRAREPVNWRAALAAPRRSQACAAGLASPSPLFGSDTAPAPVASLRRLIRSRGS
jgi:hypothetical protein